MEKQRRTVIGQGFQERTLDHTPKVNYKWTRKLKALKLAFT